MNVRVLIRIFVIFLPAVLGWACSEGSPVKEAKASESQELKFVPINVLVRPVELSNLTESITLSGEIDADKNVLFSAENVGRLEYLSVDLGDRVKKGQVLARVDSSSLKAALDQARASHDLAKKTHKRLIALFEEQLTSDQQVDEAFATLLQTKAALDIAEINYEKSVIRSSIDGFVAQKSVEVGEYLNPGQPIVQVVDFSKVIVKAQLPEMKVSSVKRGDAVKVFVAALGEEFEGKVKVVVPAAHPTSRTYEVRVNIDNPDFRILVGMSVSMRIEVGHYENVVVTPQETVVEEHLGRVVFVEQNGKAVRKSVVLGPVEGDNVLVRSGLDVGERLIVAGHRDLVDGQPVRVIAN